MSVRENLAIVILNWNKWQDTLECLASLTESTYQNFTIILIDNGSTDNSLEKIRLWAKGKISVSVGPFSHEPRTRPFTIIEYNYSEIGKKYSKPSKREATGNLVLIKSDSNLGFAKSANTGIRYALKNNFEKIFLLNNDTTVDSECLKTLCEFLDKNKTYDVVTPKICYYAKPEKIANCGGKLTFTGSRKYFCLNEKENEATKRGIKNITFASGCALLARSNVFRNYGLLTERFFFGEEDYEFSLRMKKNKVKMASILSAKIYHKVSVSSKTVLGQNKIASAFIGLLTRYVDMKFYYTHFYWKIWRIVSLGYILPMLKIKYNVSIKKLFRFARLLLQYSNDHSDVSKDDFFKAKELLGENK